ncbi:phosphatidylinositol-glycan biosynthesis class F protein [Protopterus annectens]|uniref:phosphatidylinositol-glycan biosynthesis class F protein n=1 Tax=Protopterus annectens TaxID=7888 RepID=UPI001CFA7844|nr:phosphatidylinositol-glycan biosynthesis class F protein [Protopterus annectens]XP_043915754.1 phosphatidylinositol-glycan biosynthesis class F protein [Protopterus annectens]
MKDGELRDMLSAHGVIILSIILASVLPLFFLENFSVLGTHHIWLCTCSSSVAAANISLYLVLNPSPSSKRSTFSRKVSKIIQSGLYYLISCVMFHAIFCLYGAPLLESVMETFLLAVLLSTFTTLRCLYMLGPNIHAWVRVFSKNGALTVWERSLQITSACSVMGTWLGAFPIPLDWDRPWQVWPISCSLGATFGFVVGLLFAPLWIHWHRKQLTYKSR